MTMLFSLRSRLVRVIFTREAPDGTPYACALAINDEGVEHTVLACSREHDLDHLPLLEGEILELLPTSNGHKIKPLSQQPEHVTQRLMERLEGGDAHRAHSSHLHRPHDHSPLRTPPPHRGDSVEEVARATDPSNQAPRSELLELMASVASLSKELGIRTVIWAHLPERSEAG